jgi:hypothetical protein
VLAGLPTVLSCGGFCCGRLLSTVRSYKPAVTRITAPQSSRSSAQRRVLDCSCFKQSAPEWMGRQGLAHLARFTPCTPCRIKCLPHQEDPGTIQVPCWEGSAALKDGAILACEQEKGTRACACTHGKPTKMATTSCADFDILPLMANHSANNN